MRFSFLICKKKERGRDNSTTFPTYAVCGFKYQIMKIYVYYNLLSYIVTAYSCLIYVCRIDIFKSMALFNLHNDTVKSVVKFREVVT